MQYQTVNPASGELLATYPQISDEGLMQAVNSAHEAYLEQWRSRPVKDRASVLSKAAQLLRERIDRFAALLTLEMGKRVMEAKGEVMLSAAILDYYAENVEAYLTPKAIQESPGAELHIEPIGIVLAIEPWNFPYYQVARVAGPQLAVGNVLLLKHAESVPQCALALQQLFEEAGTPPGVFTNLFASVDQIGRVIEDRRIRGITLTGSERAGAAVAERAGRSLKKVVLELGGSDPLIVLQDAPVDAAIESALVGRMFNTGQVCVGSKRIIVVGKERGRSFLESYAKRMASLGPGDPADPKTALAPLSSERALNSLLEQIARGVKAGAVVVTGGKRLDRPGYYLEPTVLTGIDARNPLYTEELFGPVAQFYIVDSEDEAIELANATPYGLGGSVFSSDIDRARRVASMIETGMVFINQPFRTSAELPFGGVKNSGFGRELSTLGFDEFVNKKLITVAPAGTPPFGPVKPK